MRRIGLGSFERQARIERHRNHRGFAGDLRQNERFDLVLRLIFRKPPQHQVLRHHFSTPEEIGHRKFLIGFGIKVEPDHL